MSVNGNFFTFLYLPAKLGRVDPWEEEILKVDPPWGGVSRDPKKGKCSGLTLIILPDIVIFHIKMYLLSDFLMPFQLLGSQPSKQGSFVANEESLAMIISMGFSREQATKALKATVSLYVTKILVVAQ